MKTLCVLALALLAGLPAGAAALDRADADVAMTRAGSAIESAEHADAARLAAADIGHAHANIERARAAYAGGRWAEAFIAADHAKLDADLAGARSRRHRAEEATARVEESVDALRDRLGMPRQAQP